MKVFNLNASGVVLPLLKTFFTHDGLTGPKNLILNPDEPRCGIIVYRSTVKSTIPSLTTIATGKSTKSPTNKLICRHKIPNFQPVVTNGSLRIKIQLNFLNFGRSMCWRKSLGPVPTREFVLRSR